jgi:hypothetical protein
MGDSQKKDVRTKRDFVRELISAIVYKYEYDTGMHLNTCLRYRVCFIRHLIYN